MKNNRGFTLIELLVIVTIVIIVILLVVNTGIQTKDDKEQVPYSYVEAVMIGNHAFIPIRKDGKPVDNTGFILSSIKKFEESSSVKVTSFSLEIDRNSSGTPIHTFGVWVTFEKK